MKISGLKKIITAGILTVLIIPSISFGFGSWTQETTARELCFLYTLSKDWQQTLDLAGRPVSYREESPVFVSYPGRNNGNQFDTPETKQQTLISYLLPSEFSDLWQIEEPDIQSVNGNLNWLFDNRWVLVIGGAKNIFFSQSAISPFI